MYSVYLARSSELGTTNLTIFDNRTPFEPGLGHQIDTNTYIPMPWHIPKVLSAVAPSTFLPLSRSIQYTIRAPLELHIHSPNRLSILTKLLDLSLLILYRSLKLFLLRRTSLLDLCSLFDEAGDVVP